MPRRCRILGGHHVGPNHVLDKYEHLFPLFQNVRQGLFTVAAQRSAAAELQLQRSTAAELSEASVIGLN
jgi:hypothetical protein